MIRFLHTSDWHLGKMLYGRSLLPDQEYFLREVFLPVVRAERPDFVVLAGDIFDRQIAPVEAIRLFDEILVRMSRELRVPFLVITGNHDGAARVSMGASLLESEGVFLRSGLEEISRPVRLTIHEQPVHIYLLPYFDPAAARAAFADEGIRGFEEAYAAALGRITAGLEPGALNILVSHCFVAGSVSSESEGPICVGGSAEVPAALFSAFDYVALGHLHAPQRAGDNGYYAGSPLKYSFDEASQRKGLQLVELEKGAHSIRMLPVAPLRELRVLEGSFEELLTSGREVPTEDYCFALLKDDAPVYMPVDRLRPYYPNLLGLRSEWMQSRPPSAEGENLRGRFLSGGDSDLSIFESFFSQICGREATEEDRAVFLRAAAATRGEGSL